MASVTEAAHKARLAWDDMGPRAWFLASNPGVADLHYRCEMAFFRSFFRSFSAAASLPFVGIARLGAQCRCCHVAHARRRLWCSAGLPRRGLFIFFFGVFFVAPRGRRAFCLFSAAGPAAPAR